MGFFSKIIDKVTPQGFIDDITGETGSDAAKESAAAQQEFIGQAIDVTQEGTQEQMDLLQPLAEFGNLDRLQAAIRGRDASGVLKADPYGYNYLQDNPLFQASVDNAARQMKYSAAAGGLGASGGLMDAIFQNYLAQGDQYFGNYLNRLDVFKNSNINREMIPVNIMQQALGAQSNILGANTANRANLLTAMGNSEAAGIVGAANSEMAGTNNLINLGAQAVGFMAGGGFGGDQTPPYVYGGGLPTGGGGRGGGFSPIYGNLGGIGL